MSELEKIEEDIECCLKCIKHWSENALLITFRIGPSVCAFCNKYIHSECIGCPIFEKTNMTACGGTPYKELVTQKEFGSKPICRNVVERENNSKIFSKYSTKEVLFLTELLDDLIKKRDELKEKELKFNIGDYVRLKDGIEFDKVINEWPGDLDIKFPNTIFKVESLYRGTDTNMFSTRGYTSGSQYARRVGLSFAVDQFEKIIPEIKSGSIVVYKDIKDKFKRIKIISKAELVQKYGDYYIGEYIHNNDLTIVNTNDIQIIQE